MARDRPVFPTMLLAAVLWAASLGLVVAAVRATLAYLPGLNLDDPPLARVTPVAGVTAPRLSRRVVLVMIDGLRLDTSFGRPFLDGLRDRGIDAVLRVGFPSLSLPGYVTLLSGVPPSDSGVRGNEYDSEVHLDSVMRRARAAGLRVTYLSASEWAVPRMFPHDIDAGGITPWPGGIDQAMASTLARGDELVLLWIGDVDVAGHAHGGDSPEYRAAARMVDDLLGRILGAVDLEKDTIVVVADHGHVDAGGHGGLEPEVIEVPLIMAGAGVKPGAVVTNAQQRDVAPTVAALLGVPAPGHALGRTLVEALALAPADAARLAASDAGRVARLDAALAAARADVRVRGEATRERRTVPLAVVVIGVIGVGVIASRRGWATFDRRVLLVAVPAFPATFYSLLVTFENWLSPSMLPERGAIPYKLFGYGAVAAACHLAAAWVSLAGRPAPRDRLAAAAGMTLVGLAGAMAVVGVSWWFGVASLVRELPEPRLLMLVPASYVSIVAYAASAVVVMGIEYTVFMARATK